MLRPCERRHCCFHVRASHVAVRDVRQRKAYSIHWSNDVEGDRFFQRKSPEATRCYWLPRVGLSTFDDDEVGNRHTKIYTQQDHPLSRFHHQSTQHNNTLYCLITQQNTPHSTYETGLS